MKSSQFILNDEEVRRFSKHYRLTFFLVLIYVEAKIQIF